MRLFNNKRENYVPCNRRALLGAVLLAIFLIALYTFGIFETLPTYTQSQVIGGIAVDLYLFFNGSKSLYIDEDGLSVFHFGIRTRYVLWSSVDQVGTGHTGAGVAIVITLKGGKRFEVYKKSGALRDADIFEGIHPKTCLVIGKNKVDKARPLVEKYYGKLDFEWIPLKE